jgi:hypothetical protein
LFGDKPILFPFYDIAIFFTHWQNKGVAAHMLVFQECFIMCACSSSKTSKLEPFVQMDIPLHKVQYPKLTCCPFILSFH